MARNGRDARNREANPTEKFWYKTIETWRNKAVFHRQNYERMAQGYRTMYYPRGEQGSAGALAFDDAVTVESNYLYAFADTLVANITPPNPTVTITANRNILKKPAEFREALINRIFEMEKFSEKLWKISTRASVWPRAFLKVVWSGTRKRPIFRVINPHYIFYDVAAEDWDDLRYICEVSVLTKEDFKARLKKRGKAGGFYRANAIEDVEFGKYPDWVEPEDDWADNPRIKEEREVNMARDGYEWTVVFELYDFKAQKFYHFADGVQKPLMTSELPYKHLPNPYMIHSFNDNLKDLGGMSDAELIYPTVERLNEMQSLEMWHCKASIPAIVIHEGLVDDPDAFSDALEAIDGPGQMLPINAKAKVGIDQVLGQTPVPTLPIEWDRSTQRLEELIEFVLGMPAYARGQVGQSDVATELALSDTATRTRNARRQKQVYNLISWTAKAVVGLFQEFMDEDMHIPMRLLDGEDEQMITAELLAFGEKTEDPWSYDYAANPYNASEQNDVVQLKQLETFLPILVQAASVGQVDIRELVKKLLDLLHMRELLTKDPPPPPAQGAEQLDQMGQVDAAMMQGGGVPMAPGVPGPAAPALLGNQVGVGTGAQAIPGGLEGGNQPGAGGGRGLL